MARAATAELRVSGWNAGVAHTSSKRNRGVAAAVIATADLAGGDQWYVEFSGIAAAEIHAGSGIWSHIGGQVSGSALVTPAKDTHVSSRAPAISVVAMTRRMPLQPMSAQS